MNNGNNTGIVQPRACMYTQQSPDILLEMCEREQTCRAAAVCRQAHTAVTDQGPAAAEHT